LPMMAAFLEEPLATATPTIQSSKKRSTLQKLAGYAS
jgi:hypothetical protein